MQTLLLANNLDPRIIKELVENLVDIELYPIEAQDFNLIDRLL
jgi:hypothetical protein